MSQTFVPHPVSIFSAFLLLPKQLRQWESKANFISILTDYRLVKV